MNSDIFESLKPQIFVVGCSKGAMQTLNFFGTVFLFCVFFVSRKADEVREGASSSAPSASLTSALCAVPLQSNNWVIHSVVRRFQRTRTAEGIGATPHLVTCTVEHDSVRLPLEHLVKEQVAGE